MQQQQMFAFTEQIYWLSVFQISVGSRCMVIFFLRCDPMHFKGFKCIQRIQCIQKVSKEISNFLVIKMLTVQRFSVQNNILIYFWL